MALGTTATAYYYEYLVGRTLENFGSATETSTPHYGGTGSTVSGRHARQRGRRQPGVRRRHRDRGGSTGGGTLINAGTLSKTGGTGTSAVAVAITDTGTVQVAAGTLSFQGGGTISGSAKLSVAAGADLDFGGGDFTASPARRSRARGRSASPAPRSPSAGPTASPARPTSAAARWTSTAPSRPRR